VHKKSANLNTCISCTDSVELYITDEDVEQPETHARWKVGSLLNRRKLIALVGNFCAKTCNCIELWN